MQHSHQNSSAGNGIGNFSALGQNHLNAIKATKLNNDSANLSMNSVPSAQSTVYLSKGNKFLLTPISIGSTKEGD